MQRKNHETETTEIKTDT